MSRYKCFDFGQVQRYSLKDRHSKVTVEDLARPFLGSSMSEFFDSLPNLLGARDLKLLADSIVRARKRRKPIIWGIGGHVMKAGLAPVLIEVMKRGFATAFAGNGSAAIHDFELGFSGRTSENVEEALKAGNFGMAEETGSLINRAIKEGVCSGKGFGEALGELMDDEKLEHEEKSLILQAYRRGIPFTIHVAVGTDITHTHPEASGRAIGAATFTDFKVFTQLVAELHGGGVYLNVGSAVVLPEVFLKAVSAVRGTSRELEEFTTANLDFIQHYRPLQNVVKRPVSNKGTGITLTGHHEIMVPLLAARLFSLDHR